MSEEETIFEQALRIDSPEERAEFLDQACAARPQLRGQVEALLNAHQQTAGILESPPVQTATAQAQANRIGTVIGRYKLLEQIGEGGMGAVFMAEQLRPVRRRVALKIIKPGMNNAQVIARFEAERQALAVMDHPNIAKVLDAGTTENGSPFFVMELVKGVPLTEYCDKHQLAPQQRLELFMQVCQAVQHAHQKGIIHRDLKPNNVLVTLDDAGKPTPKVIDFGIAKATDGQRLTDRTLFTEFRQLIGTPLYMSPEQAEMNVLADVDTRSDVYSLGVLLYELLTGTTPFEKDRLAKAAYDEVRRIIREEDPPAPSTRLSALGDALTTISAQRQTDPKKLGQLVHGELDWIVMKALEKDRGRRYQTANGFARDLERYLADQPVEASPPSNVYRLRKFARRNKAALTTACVFALVLVAATIVSLWQRHTAVAARAVAEASEKKALVSEQEAQKQAAEAQRQNRIAQRRLADGYLTQAQSDLNAGKYLDAKTRVDKATAAYLEIGDDPLPADFMWLSAYSRAPAPLLRIDAEAGRPEVRILPDGRSAVIRRGIGTAMPGLAELIDLRTGAVLRKFEHEHPVNATALSSDGRFLITGGGAEVGATVKMSPAERRKTFELTMWDVATGQVIKKLAGHTDILRFIELSRDGKRAVSSAVDKSIKVWDLESGKIIHEHSSTTTVNYVLISPDGRLIVTNETGGKAGIWDVDAGVLRYDLEHHGRSYPRAFSPDGTKVLLADAIWDYRNAKFIDIATGTAACYFPDQGRILTGESNQIGIRDAYTGQLYFALTEPYTAWQVGMSADGKHLVSGAGSMHGAIVHWMVERQVDILSIRREASSGQAQLVVTPDGRAAVCPGPKGTIAVWDLATGLRLRQFSNGTSEFRALAISPDGQQILAGAQDGFVRLWDMRPGDLIRSWRVSEAGTYNSAMPIATVAISPDGRRAVTGGDDAIARTWDLATGKQLTEFRGHWNPNAVMTRTISAAIFTSDGSEVISSCIYDNTIRAWNPMNGQEARVVLDRGTGQPTPLRCFQRIRDHELLWGSNRGTHVIDTRNGKETLKIEGYVAGGTPDGRLIATSEGGNFCLWDGKSGRELSRLQYDGAFAIAFSPDGRYLAALSGGVILVRDLKRPSRFREFDRSLAAARRTLQGNADDATALQTLGEWYAFRDVCDWGAEFLEKARTRGATISNLTLARCYWRIGKRDEAQREFKLAIDRGEAPRPYLELCLSAVAAMPKASTAPTPEIPHDDQWVWKHAISPEAWAQNPAHVLALCRQLTEGKPENDIYWQMLGWALYRSGEYKQSIEALEHSIKLSDKPKGGDAWQWLFLAMDYAKLGQPEIARAWYSASLQWFDENPQTNDSEGREIRAEAATLLGVDRWPFQATEAERQVYERILKLNKDAEWPQRQLDWVNHSLGSGSSTTSPATQQASNREFPRN